MTDNVKAFMKTFEAKIEDAEIYMVGGCVRDFLMGNEPHDYDFCTNVSVDEMEPHFSCVNIGQSKDFGITSIQFNGESFEVAQFRQDGEYTNNRHPDCVEFDATLEQDLARRDFSMNAIAMDIDGNMFDPYSGEDAIKIKRIVAVGHPHDRFDEDALRILRALRFSATLGFELQFDIERAIVDKCDLLHNLSQERVTGEIRKVAQKGGKAFYDFLELIDDNGIMEDVFPELEKMKEFKQYFLHHPEGCTMKSVDNGVVTNLNLDAIEAGTHMPYDCGSVFDHQMSVMRCLPEDASEAVVFGALFHDVAKPMTAEWKDDDLGTCSYKRHEYKGVELFEEIAKKRKIGGELRESTKFCIAQHMNMNNKELTKKSTILNMALNPFFDTLAQVSRADDMSRNVNGNVLYVEEEFDKNLQKFLDARDTYVDTSALKAKIAKFIDGKKVMDICKIKPSRKIGHIIETVTEYLTDHDFDVSVEDVDKIIAILGKCEFTEDGEFDMSGISVYAPPIGSGAYDMIKGV
jgi:tRNA nucleotidyltransferase (CCA-adding enzyme)